MRKVLTIAIAALMVVAVAGAASAAVDNWRVNLKADDGTGKGSGAPMQIGAIPTATDGADLGVVPVVDREAAYGADISGTSRWVVGNMNDGLTYERDIKSPASPYTYSPIPHKVWDLRVAALPSADNNPIRLVFMTTTQLPSPVDQEGKPLYWELVMIDNKGMVGAPANGTIWQIPIPTAHSTNPFWTMDTAADINGVVWGNMPMIKLSSATHASMLSQGYHMQFRVVPEPSSLLAMASGLTGLAGFVIRRRRA